MVKRVFLIVLDSFGVGNAPDADAWGDEGANTLRSVSRAAGFNLPNLGRMGLFNIDGVDCGRRVSSPTAAFGRLAERSAGKDTTVGHWELCGVVSHTALPTYPDGFPEEILGPFARETGRDILCNRPYSGTEVIRDFGAAHMESGGLIVYTSADSVFQIAAHEAVVPLEELYRHCRTARKLLTGAHGVGRVVARPFAGEPGAFERTPNRHDFSLDPPRPTLLDRLKDRGLEVIGVGKIHDIFAGRGMTRHCHTAGNAQGMKKALECAQGAFHGLCFVNLVDFDSLYGHRRDVDGYARALMEFDAWLRSFLAALGEEDLLMITADHGCDPGFLQTTDHTREQIPLLVWGHSVKPGNLGSRVGFGDVGASIARMLGVDADLEGTSFWPAIQAN